VRRVDNAAPFHIEADLRDLREAGRKNLGEGAFQIVIIECGCREPEGSLSGSKVHIHAVGRNKYRPKHTILVDVWIVVVNLIGSNGTIEEIQSDEPERCVVVLSVHCHVFTDHKAHVGLEVQ